jgi:hypothetical protein
MHSLDTIHHGTRTLTHWIQYIMALEHLQTIVRVTNINFHIA